MVIHNRTQVPDGTSAPILIWPIGDANPLASPDYILQYYRQTGDAYNLDLYKTERQVLVEGYSFAGISIENMWNAMQ